MKIGDEPMPAQACLGDGPVDAALNTIRQIVNIPCVLTSFVVKAITGGTDADRSKIPTAPKEVEAPESHASSLHR